MWSAAGAQERHTEPRLLGHWAQQDGRQCPGPAAPGVGVGGAPPASPGGLGGPSAAAAAAERCHRSRGSRQHPSVLPTRRGVLSQAGPARPRSVLLALRTRRARAWGWRRGAGTGLPRPRRAPRAPPRRPGPKAGGAAEPPDGERQAGGAGLCPRQPAPGHCRGSLPALCAPVLHTAAGGGDLLVPEPLPRPGTFCFVATAGSQRTSHRGDSLL